MGALNPVAGIGTTWAMVQDHGYTPGAVILFGLVVLAYALGAVVVLALGAHLGARFLEGFRAGLRRSRSAAE